MSFQDTIDANNAQTEADKIAILIRAECKLQGFKIPDDKVKWLAKILAGEGVELSDIDIMCAATGLAVGCGRYGK